MEFDATQILEQRAAIISGTHVVYTSGRHGNAYINKDAVYPDTEATSRLCLAIAEHFVGVKPDVVAAPALGGIILSQWTAHHLTRLGSPTLSVFAEKDDKSSLAFRRGYDVLLKGKRVLVVEDVLTTGGSVRTVVEAVRVLGAEVIGVAALCNRGNVRPSDIANPPELFALVEIQLESWAESDCPLCRDKIPINTSVGKGREFLQRLKN